MVHILLGTAFYRIVAIASIALDILHSYNPIHCSVYGLCWSCVARPTSVQDIKASNMAIHRRGRGHASVELSVVASVDV